jgi:hypothetical protein
MSLVGVVQRDTIKPQEETTIETYDDTAALVIEEFSKLGESATFDDLSVIDANLGLPRRTSFEMIGYADWFSWMESG